MRPRRWRWSLAAVGVVVAISSALAAPARATYGGRTTADEPQYLLSAISLAEDLDLDISDELREERWREFHEADLPRQTEPTQDGREFSPHDPLLPLFLAAPVAGGGWLGAKLALSLLAGALAAATMWVAVRRFGVSPAVAGTVTLAFGLTAPLAAYGTQVYPELPAALAVVVAVGALTGPVRGRGLVVLGICVVALPWLAVKYVPVAVVLAAIGLTVLVRGGDRRRAQMLVGGLAVAGLAFLAFHRVVYGGWTVYAAGDHFVGGEVTVVGTDPDYPGRSLRLLGLLVDRGFGLVAWAPVFLLAPPALAAWVRRRPDGWPAVAVPLAAGWATATWVALTMHGFWWPGRQVVVVVPLMVLACAWWVDREPTARPWFAVAAVLGVVSWAWVAVEVLQERLRLIIDFEQTRNPWVRAWRLVLPDLRDTGARTTLLLLAWGAVLATLVVVGWRSGDGGRPGENQDPSTGEGVNADMPAVDLDRERAIG